MPRKKADTAAALEMNLGDFAALVRRNHQTVSAWVKRDGMPGARQVGRTVKIDLREALPWREQWWEKALADAKAGGGGDLDDAKQAKLEAEAKLKAMDVAEREGRLLPADQVGDRWAQMMTAIRESVMSCAGAAVQSGLVDPTGEAALEGLLRDALVNAKLPEGGDDE